MGKVLFVKMKVDLSPEAANHTKYQGREFQEKGTAGAKVLMEKADNQGQCYWSTVGRRKADGGMLARKVP